MSAEIRLISSMATKILLQELAAPCARATGSTLNLVAAGAVDVVKRIKSGEVVDIVMLAAAAIDDLIADGKIIRESRVDVVTSPTAVAVRKGGQRYDISSEAALKKTALEAGSVGYSSGSSGVFLEKILTRWDPAGRIKRVQTPPGVPVGSLLASGEVVLGFQQLSELIHIPDVDILGPMPDEIGLLTTFSAGVSASSAQPDAARSVLSYLISPATHAAMRKNGLNPA